MSKAEALERLEVILYGLSLHASQLKSARKNAQYKLTHKPDKNQLAYAFAGSNPARPTTLSVVKGTLSVPTITKERAYVRSFVMVKRTSRIRKERSRHAGILCDHLEHEIVAESFG